jgi:hypothetical protein
LIKRMQIRQLAVCRRSTEESALPQPPPATGG